MKQQFDMEVKKYVSIWCEVIEYTNGSELTILSWSNYEKIGLYFIHRQIYLFITKFSINDNQTLNLKNYLRITKIS